MGFKLKSYCAYFQYWNIYGNFNNAIFGSFIYKVYKHYLIPNKIIKQLK